jgi:hypothetical protein
MIVTIVTFKLTQPASLADITKTFRPRRRNIRRRRSPAQNYWMSEDGRAAATMSGIARRCGPAYTAEWKKFVEGIGAPPQIEYLHSPVMVDNRDGSIKVAA